MKEQFIPYELALKLKEIGYDENVLAEYDLNKEFFFYSEMDGNTKLSCKAPLWQQAFEWFMMKDYFVNIVRDYDCFIEYHSHTILVQSKSKSLSEIRVKALEEVIEHYESKLSNSNHP